MGGQGDCGYRAAAGARHFCKKLTHLTARQAHTDAAELRAQVVLHCKKHASRFQQAFCPEDESKAHQRNQKPPAQTFQEWAENQADPKVWANSFSFQAMAERTGMIIIIWKKLPDDSWMRCTFASKFKHRQACAARKEAAVVLLLKKQHFTYLIPPPSLRIPTAWLAGEGNPSPETIDLTGEGKSSSARSQRTNSSTLPAKSKATSALTPRSKCESKTVHSQPRSRASSPSVHTWNGNSFSCTDTDVTPSVHTFVQSRSRKSTSKVKKSILKGNKLRTQPSGVSSRFARSSAASMCHQGTVPTGASHRRLTGKQTVFHDLDSLPQQVRSPSQQAEALVWKCRLCGHIVTASHSRQLNWRRLNHFKCRHPTHKKTDSDKWIKLKMQAVISTSAIPREARDWQCPWCDCGLPQCETKHQRAISIQKHYKDAHSRRIDKSQKAKGQAAAKRRKHDPVANERWLASNKQKSESQSRLNEARRDFQTAGHELVQFPTQPEYLDWHSASCRHRQIHLQKVS